MIKRSTLLSLVAALVLVFSVTGCGGPSDEQLIRENLDSILSSYSMDNEDFANEANSIDEDFLEPLGVDSETFWTAYFEGYSYEIGDVSIDGDTAQAEVTVSVKPVGDMMVSYQNEISEWVASADPTSVTSESDLYEQAGQILLDVVEQTEPVQQDVVFNYTKNDNGWVMDYSSQTELGALFGV